MQFIDQNPYSLAHKTKTRIDLYKSIKSPTPYDIAQLTIQMNKWNSYVATHDLPQNISHIQDYIADNYNYILTTPPLENYTVTQSKINTAYKP